VAGNSRTITIKFDGSAKGLISSATAASAAIKRVGEDTSGLKKAQNEADNLSKKLDETAKDSKEKGSLMGGLFAVGLSAAAPAVSAALVGGVALGFVGVAGLVQKNNQQVKDSFGDLKSQVVGEMTSASDQVVPYLVKSGHALQQEFANLGPQLDEAFKYAGPDVKILTDGVDKLADNAMPGLVNTMRNSKPIVQGISDVLGDLGTTASTVLDSVSSHGQEFKVDLDQIGSLIKNVGSIGAGVLPGLASGFGTSIGTVNTLLTVLKPVAPAIGDITGEVLPAVGAFKLFGLATSPLNKLGSKVAGVSSNLGGFTKKLTGSDTAGARVTTTTAKLGGALGKVGNALPLVGAGFALASAGAQALYGNQDQLANSLLTQTGPALKATEDKLVSNAKAARANHDEYGFLGDAINSAFIPTLQSTEEGLTDVQKAQIGYNTAVVDFGPKSKQAATAQRALASATAADQQSQQNLAIAAQDVNTKLNAQTTALLNDVSAGLGFQSSVLGVTQAQQSYAASLKSTGANSLATKQASIAYQQALVQEVTSAGDAAAAHDKNGTASDKARVSQQAETATILGLAGAAGKNAPPALKAMVAGLTDTQTAAFAATGKIAGTHTEVVNLPNGKTIKINVDGTGQAVKNVNAVKTAIAGVKSKSVFLDTYVNTILKGPATTNKSLSGLLGITPPHRAKGGPALAGMPYVVGDGGGPEIFVPNQTGRVIGTSESADILGGGTGGGTGVGGWSGDLVVQADLGAGMREVLRISNRDLRARVKAGAGAR
jgi:hypothetical protein